MSRKVNPTRRYDSPRRREQAAETRREILEAAERLFLRDGYPATTMAAIAAEARVSPKTVYLAVQTKSGLLRALWHLRLRGDLEDVPVGEREEYRSLLDEPDPERQLRLTARRSREVKLRVGGLFAVIRGAALSDPDIAELWRRIQTEFHANQRGIVAAIHAHGGLRAGLDVDEATDVLWTLNHPDLWHLLVGERGWTPEAYERWTADAACQQILTQG